MRARVDVKLKVRAKLEETGALRLFYCDSNLEETNVSLFPFFLFDIHKLSEEA